MSEIIDVEVGTTAPDFTLMSASGEEVTLSSYRDKQHVILFFMREFI